MEEKENIKRKKIKSLMLIFVGLLVFILGIVIVASNDFNQGLAILGMILFLGGGAIIGVGSEMLSPKKSIDEKSINIEDINKFVNNINQQINKEKNLNSDKLKKCIYCGSLVKVDATECDSCGGKDFKKHKQR